MAITNRRRGTTLNIQSDPIDNGNDLLNDEKESSVEKVSISITNTDEKAYSNPLADNRKIVFGSSQKRIKTRRKQQSNSYSVLKKIPASSISRTMPVSLSPSLTIRDQSSVRLYIPTIKKIKEDVESKSTKDEISIGSMIGADRYLLEHSISNLRPELIASFDWMPARSSSGRKGYIESLLEFRWAMRMLQIENVEETIKRLKDVDIGGVYSKLEEKYDYYTEKEQQWLDWREKILSILIKAKKTLDIKDNSSTLRSATSRLYSKKSLTGSSIGQNTSLQSLFINELGFSEEGYEKFSNSKVYGQLIYDLYYACRHHSPSLITDKATSRKKDQHSTSLNHHVIPRSKYYKFRVWTPGNKDIKGSKKSRKFDATKYKDYSRLLASLPADDSDKIKVLTTSISNEMSVSSGIGYLTGTSLGKRYNTDITNPFVWPLGRVRKNILDDGWPRGSLASFVLLTDSKDRLILPFETREFSDKEGKTAISGATALVDGIMRFGTLSDGLDFEPYYDFGTELKNNTDDVAEYINLILNLDDPDQKLHARKIFLNILSALKQCIIGTTNANKRDEQQLIIAALMNLSRENPKLRHALVRMVFEIRDANDQLIVDTGAEEFLEADADSPKPRPPDPRMHLSQVGGFQPWTAITSEWIQKTYNISSNTAINLVHTSSSWSDMGERAKEARREEARERRKNYYKLASKWQKTSLWASILARKTMDNQRRPPAETNTRSIIKVRTGGIISALKRSAYGYRSTRSPFFHIIKIARELQEQSVALADRDSGGGTYMSDRRLTKYNGWDENALITMVFEIFSILYSRLIDSELVRHNDSVYVKYSAEKNDRTADAIEDVLLIATNEDPLTRAEQIKARQSKAKQNDEIILTSDMMEGKLSVIDALQSASNNSSSDAIFSDIQSFVTAFEKEVEFKALAVSHLQAIGDSMGSSAEIVKTFFNTSEEDFSTSGNKKYESEGRFIESSRIRRYMAWKTRTWFGRDVLRSLTPHQLALQRVASEKLSRKKNDPSYLPSEMIIEAEEMSALKSFLASPEMRGTTGGNIRVMTVGIPMDTIDILQNPPYTMGRKNNSELSKAKDVFEVHVHKRDLEYEDIVFKPKKFVYDRSIFLMPDAFRKINPTQRIRGRKKIRRWNFDQMVKRTEFTMATMDNLSHKSAMQLYKHWKYSGIPEQKRVDMIQNHITNRLLQLYYRLMNGLVLDENTFLKHEDWGQLMVDADAAQMLRLAQGHDRTKWWISAGTIPVGNLLISTKIQKNERIRVATFKDASIWAKPTLTQLAKLARDTRISELGNIRGMYRKLTYKTYSKKASVFSKITPFARKVRVSTRNQIRTRALSGKNTLHRKGFRANPKILFKMHRRNSAWNSVVKRHNKSIAEKNQKNRAHNNKLRAYQAKQYSFLIKRYYAKKPRLSSYHMQHFRMICASRILGPCVMINQILAPRTFDRIIMLPIDPDDFEIDMVATSNILKGKSSAERKEFMKMTEEVQASDGRIIRKLKPRRRSENYSSFNDFFVTISTLTLAENS